MSCCEVHVGCIPSWLPTRVDVCVVCGLWGIFIMTCAGNLACKASRQDGSGVCCCCPAGGMLLCALHACMEDRGLAVNCGCPSNRNNNKNVIQCEQCESVRTDCLVLVGRTGIIPVQVCAPTHGSLCTAVETRDACWPSSRACLYSVHCIIWCSLCRICQKLCIP